MGKYIPNAYDDAYSKVAREVVDAMNLSGDRIDKRLDQVSVAVEFNLHNVSEGKLAIVQGVVLELGLDLRFVLR